MKTMLRDRDYDRDDHDDTPDTELTLGMGSLLGIFFGVVLVCGVFFGFGYSIGRHNPPFAPATAAGNDAQRAGSARHVRRPPDTLTNTDAANAADDSVSAAHAQAPAADSENPNFPAGYETPSPDEAPASTRSERLRSGGTRVIESDTSQPASETALQAAEPPRPHAAAPAKPRPVPPPSPAADQASAPGAASPLVVQIAAVSRREDAEVLSTALRKHGFSPMVRNGLADSFYHVQVGPFTNRTVAEATREKLLADGYNAILK